MNYTVSEENFNKAIDYMGMLDHQLAEMERNNKAHTTTYHAMNEKLLDEMCVVSILMGVEVKEIADKVNESRKKFDLQFA